MKPVFLWSFGFLFLSLCLCWIRISLSVLLKRISSGRVRCSCYNGPSRSLRVKVSSRKLWPSSRNSTVSRLSWFRQVISSGSSLQRTRRWLSLGGLGSMNVQLHTAACAIVLSSKETKGEKTDYEMRWLAVDYDYKPVRLHVTDVVMCWIPTESAVPCVLALSQDRRTAGCLPRPLSSPSLSSWRCVWTLSAWLCTASLTCTQVKHNVLLYYYMYATVI